MTARKRLEEIRIEIENERVSYGELMELQSLAKYIDPSDVLLLEWAGVPENAEAKAYSEENIERASRAEAVLQVYADDYDQGSGTGERIVDLLADMMHYAYQNDQDWAVIESSAKMHWLAEEMGGE